MINKLLNNHNYDSSLMCGLHAVGPNFKVVQRPRPHSSTVARECQRANQVWWIGIRRTKARRNGYASVWCWNAGMDTWGSSEYASVARRQGV